MLNGFTSRLGGLGPLWVWFIELPSSAAVVWVKIVLLGAGFGCRCRCEYRGGGTLIIVFIDYDSGCTVINTIYDLSSLDILPYIYL